MNRGVWVAVCSLSLSVGLGIAVTMTTVAAEEGGIDLNSPEVIKAALDQPIGKRVKVKLESGQDLESKVAKVGAHALQLTELTDMEFYNATVRFEGYLSGDHEDAHKISIPATACCNAHRLDGALTS